MKALLTMIILLGSISFNYAQIYGCTDSQAINYDENATINDGSCTYAQTHVFSNLMYQLPAILEETSGLILFRDKLVSMNDSGGEPKLYFFNRDNGDLEQTITIGNATNVDWEEVAQDNYYIYVGDFGNNYGNRTDLKVYKIRKNDIPTSGNATVAAEIINFSYADQEYQGDNNYDCEACFVVGNNMYLFSKSWTSMNSRAYRLPLNPGTYSLQPIEEFDVNGLITAADINEQENIAVLLGYKDYNTFLWILHDFQNDLFFSGNKRRLDFQNMFGRQTEGICFVSEDELYMTAESAGVYQASAFNVNIAQFINAPTAISEVLQNRDGYKLLFDKYSGYLSIESNHDNDIKGERIVQVFDILGRQLVNDFIQKDTKFNKIYLGRLNPGIYMVRISANHHTFAGKIRID